MARSSNQRKLNYIQLFAEIDDLRSTIISLIVKETIEHIWDEEPTNAETYIDELVGKLEFVNEIADNTVNAIGENKILNG